MSKNNKHLWTDTYDSDFECNKAVTDIDIGDYNLEKMKVFSFNINAFRQITRLSDSLKPIDRRILYAMYLSNAKPGTKPQKSNPIVANTMLWHPHSDLSIYSTVVGLTQYWKKAIPLIDGCGTNFGNEAHPEKYADSRYTEAKISKYAWECFFEDYDDDCVEKVFNSAYDKYEPMSLPSKFPNIIINGGTGIAVGNAFGIPPYNVEDVVALCKRLLVDPDHSDIYIIPDFPTGCDVEDNGRSIREICENGVGRLKLKATIDILEEVYNKKPVWVLQVKNLPWLTSLTNIDARLVELTKKNVLPIKDTQNKSYQIYDKDDNVKMVIDYRIIIDKSHDPHKIRQKIYNVTELQRTLYVNFKVVMENLQVKKLNMRELVLSWIDERRAYKRRLLNKKITKLMARVSLLEILLRLLDKDNIEKTMTIIKNSNHNEIVDRLKEHGNMSSFQATKIADMKLSAFTKDATEKYNSELIKIKEDLEITMSLIKSEKKIDKIILSELDDLKKYASPRKSRIVEPENGTQIANTEHSLIITSQGLIKKLFYEESRHNDTAVGSFKNLDYPTHRIIINNLDSIMLFDSFGKYSCVPVHSIDSTELSSHGKPIYDYSKLNGKIVSAFQYINKDTEEYIENQLNETINMITLSKCGFIKKTKVEEFGSTKTRNSIAMKIQENDELVFANAIMDSANVLIYTKKGKYIFMYANTIPLIGKNVMGVLGMNLDVDDECVGLSVIGENDEFIVVVTEKGNIKKCESRYLMADMKKRNSTYVATLDVGDSIIYVGGAKEKDKLFVCSRASYQNIPVEEIPLLPRKAKCQKIISVPQGNNIISALIN